MVSERLEHKDKIRAKGYGMLKDKTILVLQLVEFSLPELHRFMDMSLRVDFASRGSTEAWLADYTGIEAYGNVELFGIFPEKSWGYFRRQGPGKPYG